jgi:hypothetical protein
VDEFLESPKTLGDRTVGQWRNMKVALHYFPPEAQRWMLLHVFDREQVVTPDGRVPPGKFNPTTHGQFNDTEVRFWSEQFWNPAALKFDDPKPTSCEKHFQDRIMPGSVMN